MPPEPAGPAPPLTLAVAELHERLEGFVTDYLKEKSPETAGTYRRALNEFERYHAVRAAGAASAFPFSEKGVEEYKRYLMAERALSQVSVSTYLTALRRLCDYLVARGDLAENPARGVQGNRRPESHSRGVLTAAEAERLLAVIPDANLIGTRDRALASLMLFAGLGEIELVRADVGDVERTLLGASIRVQGKGRTAKDETVPLDAPALGPLDAYLDARGPLRAEDPLFLSHGRRSATGRLDARSMRSRITGHLRAAGLKRRGISPHSLTHTAALVWLNDGMPLEEVRRRMRHGTLETTMIHFRKQGLLLRRPAEDGG